MSTKEQVKYAVLASLPIIALVAMLLLNSQPAPQHQPEVYEFAWLVTSKTMERDALFCFITAHDSIRASSPGAVAKQLGADVSDQTYLGLWDVIGQQGWEFVQKESTADGANWYFRRQRPPQQR